MPEAKALIERQQRLKSDRIYAENSWYEIVQLCMPHQSRKFDYPNNDGYGRGGTTAAMDINSPSRSAVTAVDRSIYQFNSSPAVALERLTAGIHGLLVPPGSQWHGLEKGGLTLTDTNQSEREFLESVTKYLFKARYAAKCGFSRAIQQWIKSTCGLGTGVIEIIKNDGQRRTVPVEQAPFFHKFIPLIDCFMDVDSYGDVDTMFRVTDELSYRAAVAFFKSIGKEEGIHPKMLEMANDPEKMDQKCSIMKVVMPNEDYNSSSIDMNFVSIYVDIANEHIITPIGGYESFPFMIGWWDQPDGGAFGQGAVSPVLSSIKMLNAVTETSINAFQQSTMPALALANNIQGAKETIDLNPQATNPGLVAPDGSMMVKPIITGVNPAAGQAHMEMLTGEINAALFNNIFQILVDKPNQSATESLLRDAEKGELLSPSGLRMEYGIAEGVNREITILNSLGMFADGAQLAPEGEPLDIGLEVVFTNPLFDLRRAREATSLQNFLGQVGTIAQYDQETIEYIDTYEALEIARAGTGVPSKVMHSQEEVQEKLQSKIEQQEAQARQQMLLEGSKAAEHTAKSIKTISEVQ